MNKTGIDYLDYTWNPTKGCSEISTGCRGCWAKAMAKRLAGMGAGGYDKDDPFKVVCFPEKLEEPLSVKKPSRIGVSFMGDLFHDNVPFEFVEQVWDTMFDCSFSNNFGEGPAHSFMILTKRVNRMADFAEWMNKAQHRQIEYPNVHFGCTVCNQKEADEKIPILLSIPAAHRFVSLEPMLGKISLRWGGDRAFNNRMYQEKSSLSEYDALKALDLVILGGESGPKARPMHPDWARSVRDQCQSAGVPFHFKQWGEFAVVDTVGDDPDPKGRSAMAYSDGTIETDWEPGPKCADAYKMFRVGKQKAGRLLDGREWNGE